MMRTEKVEAIAGLEQVLREAKSVYLADFQGMTVEVLSELRKRCRKANVRVEVVKNTLLRRAAESVGVAALSPALKGPTALVTSAVDEIAPAQRPDRLRQGLQGAGRQAGRHRREDVRPGGGQGDLRAAAEGRAPRAARGGAPGAAPESGLGDHLAVAGPGRRARRAG